MTIEDGEKDTQVFHLRAGDRVRLWDGHILGIEKRQEGLGTRGQFVAFTGEDETTGKERSVMFEPGFFVAAEVLERAVPLETEAQ